MGELKSEGPKKYASFLDSVFTNIQTKKVENLVVNIRGNSGGNTLTIYYCKPQF